MPERRWLAAGVVLVGAVSLLLWWPLLSRDGARVWTGTTPDADQFVWSARHTLDRIASLRNPFLTDAIFAGTGGANLAFNTVAPGVALVVAPITLAAGPFAGVTAATLAMPVLMLVAVNGLLRGLAPSAPPVPRWIGAAVVALSPFVVLKSGHHMNLVAGGVVVVLCAWAGVRWWSSGGVRPAVWFGVAAGATAWVSTEMLVHGAIALATAVVVAIATGHVAIATCRTSIRTRVRDLALAAAVAVVVAAPFLLAYVAGPERFTGDYHPGAQDLFGVHPANLVLPDRSRAVSAVAEGEFGTLPAEATGYVSMLGLVVAGWLTWRYRRAGATGRTAIVTFWILVLLSLGSSLHVGDRRVGVLPWVAIEHLPVVGQAIPNRLSLFALLALVVAALDATRHVRIDRNAIVVGLGLLAILWFPVRPFGTETIEPRLPEVLAERCADRDVLVTPQRGAFGVTYMQRSMAWQADADLAFDLVRGWAFRSSSPSSGDPLLVDELVGTDRIPTDVELDAMRAELDESGAGCVVAAGTDGDPLTTLLGQPDETADGWRVWTL